MATAKRKATTKKARKRSLRKTASSKIEKAVYIMEKMFFKEQKARKEILPVLMKECALSRAGASTYYQSIKNRILEDES